MVVGSVYVDPYSPSAEGPALGNRHPIMSKWYSKISQARASRPRPYLSYLTTISVSRNAVDIELKPITRYNIRVTHAVPSRVTGTLDHRATAR